MPLVKPLREDLNKYLRRFNLEKKFTKQVKLFESNYRHPSLHTELLEPKDKRIYSFRIDQKYRALFIYAKGKVEIIKITSHYK